MVEHRSRSQGEEHNMPGKLRAQETGENEDCRVNNQPPLHGGCEIIVKKGSPIRIPGLCHGGSLRSRISEHRKDSSGAKDRIAARRTKISPGRYSSHNGFVRVRTFAALRPHPPRPASWEK